MSPVNPSFSPGVRPLFLTSIDWIPFLPLLPVHAKSSLPPDLPTEVCERIIDYCVGHIGTLHSCALTCRSWFPRSRSLLFNALYLWTEYDVTRVIRSLYAQPRNAEFVQTLTIYDERDAGAWLSDLPFALVNLQELSFADLSLLNAHTRFPFSLSLFRSVTMLSLGNVQFRTFNQFVLIVTAFTGVTRLTLEDVSWSNNLHATTAVQVVGRRKCERLRYAKLVVLLRDDKPGWQSTFNDIVNFMVSTSSSASLGDLELCMMGSFSVNERTIKGLASMLNLCGPILHYLKLRLQNVDRKYFPLLSQALEKNVNLENLNLNVAAHLQAVLLSAASSNRMVTVKLSGSQTLLEDGANHWRDIDRIFARSNFKNLKNVGVDLQDSQDAADIWRRLPMLHARGILS